MRGYFGFYGFRAPRFWYNSHIINSFLGIPSWLLGMLVLMRRVGSKKKVIRYPSVGVGSLALGGAGKTTLTLKLAEIIKEKGRKVGIVHSGYGGHMEGIFFTPEGMADKISDEVLLYLKRGFPISVFRDRLRAFDLIKDISDCVLFDDFFSSLIQPSLQIIVFTRESFGNGLIQPFGPLREPLASLAYVDYVLVEDRSPEWVERKLERFLSKVFYFSTYVKGIIWWQGKGEMEGMSLQPISQIQGSKAILVSAVAIPKRFTSIVRRHNIHVYEHYVFGDHCWIPESAIEDIRQKMKEGKVDIVLTSEKDFWKIVNYGRVDFPLAGVVIDFNLQSDLIDKIVNCSGEGKNFCLSPG